ncbi:MAG: DUF3482 domain-containing protein [Planctomycetia bacterium]|nr:DUF3482 domain-containing protein [Planctomycetia bacterium]
MRATSEELQKLKPVVISVIGPTNEGKTSVLRTLTADPTFGQVNARAGTTVLVEIQKVMYKGVELLQLVDTPGFQMSGELLERLEENNGGKLSPDLLKPDHILKTVAGLDDNFRHDIKAWKEVVRSDIVIYVANMMESPKQSLTQDTLSLLSNAGKPIIVLFNNVNASGKLLNPGEEADLFRKDWIEELRRYKLYLYQIYDAHRRNFSNEVELFEKILVHVLDPIAHKILKLEIQDRQVRERRRMERSRGIIADFILNTASVRKSRGDISPDDREIARKELADEFNKEIFIREHQAHIDILAAWDFKPGILERMVLPLSSIDREANDLFGSDAWKKYLSGATTGAAVGAGIGLALDIAFAGLSLGTGTVIGGMIGGLVGSGINGFHHFSYDKHKKIITITPQKDVLLLLLARAVQLVRKLQARGKALEDGVQVSVSLNPERIEDKELIAFTDEILKKNDLSLFNRGLKYFAGEKNSNEEKDRSKLLRIMEKLLPSPDEISFSSAD